jgi:hypothetical protein
MIKRLLVCVVFLIPILAMAQGGGHVGRRRHQQQQQQMLIKVYKYSIIRGEDAQRLYEDLIIAGLPEQDRSESCSLPVKIISGVVHDQVTTCFDRGTGFSGSRYKCYIQKEHQYASSFVAALSELSAKKPGFCGGDGNHQLRQE